MANYFPYKMVLYIGVYFLIFYDVTSLDSRCFSSSISGPSSQEVNSHSNHDNKSVLSSFISIFYTPLEEGIEILNVLYVDGTVPRLPLSEFEQIGEKLENLDVFENLINTECHHAGTEQLGREIEQNEVVTGFILPPFLGGDRYFSLNNIACSRRLLQNFQSLFMKPIFSLVSLESFPENCLVKINLYFEYNSTGLDFFSKITATADIVEKEFDRKKSETGVFFHPWLLKVFKNDKYGEVTSIIYENVHSKVMEGKLDCARFSHYNL